jgi:putative transposase
MPRANRIVIPDIPHHITQRGNRQQNIFFDDVDRGSYMRLLSEACLRTGTKCLAWCLMDNHIHLILVPPSEDGLRATLSSAHTSFTQRLNLRQGFSGHVFQGRFASYPMDMPHLMAAVRYIENNPVKAGLVVRAEEWRWSSARAHIHGVADGLTDWSGLEAHYRNWSRVLAEGWEQGDGDEAIEAAIASGIPIGNAEWLAGVRRDFGVLIKTNRRGRPRKAQEKGTVPFSR